MPSRLERETEYVISMEGLTRMVLSDSTNNLAGAASWFAVQVKATHEKRVTSMFDYGGVEWFLPLAMCSRRWSDRIKRVELPLFPGYIFCRFAAGQRARILKTPSVIRIVGVGDTPMPIEDQEIEAIQKVMKSGFTVLPHPFLRIGERIRILSGPLSGLEGLIGDIRQRKRLILSVTLLRRSIAVEIDSACVEAVYSAEKRVRIEHAVRDKGIIRATV